MTTMRNTALVEHILDRVLPAADFQPLLDHIADDVKFEVTAPDGTRSPETRGKQAVMDYFANIGDIVTFWQVKVYGSGERVVVLGDETFTIQNRGVTIRSEFALMFGIHGGLITRLLIIEDLSAFAAPAAAIGDDLMVPALFTLLPRSLSPSPARPPRACGIPS